MSPAPTLEPEAGRLYQQLAPVTGKDEENGWATAHLCAVLMAPIERIAALALEDGERPGFAKLMNVDDCDLEDLPWLAQFNGTILSGKEPEEEARRLIREARGSHRGTHPAIVSDIAVLLTGTKHANLLERCGNPFANIITTKPSETPDETAIIIALGDRAAKPLGATYTLVVTNVWIVAEVEYAYRARTVAELEADFAGQTVSQFEEHGVI